ncbi:histone-lysine N-methyltransferase SETDB1-B-like [Ctenopharyngodon idella]|uniref:histone-lysine N-methyltransferase SETDB1-B-like n=1 Tax=Ctenopharyngodon idella TaxID=7959 RepID=UPI00223256AF|nr:histone-lysine N-methyltransferase SETDB1-B-like [Ctenopharyngodon idella]
MVDTKKLMDMFISMFFMTEIRPGSSVTLSCQLYSYDRYPCDTLVHTEGIELIWVNQAGVSVMTDSRYQISFSSTHCISTLTTTLLNEDLNREWRCLVTQRNQLKTSATYTVKDSEIQDSKDGLSVSAGEERKPPPMPEETGKSKVASCLTSQSSTSADQSVKVEGGMKTEKKDVMTLSDSDDVQTISSGSDDNKEREKKTQAVVKRQVAVKSTRGIALKSHGLMVKTGGGGGGGGGSGQSHGHGGGGGEGGPKNTRQFFDGEESCYIIDAKLEGNLGCYLNHSCSPNLFVQNVFVDTHDLCFPWVAVFTSKQIRGTELTWDYNYEVGSVEGKELLCCCGSTECRGRLL